MHSRALGWWKSSFQRPQILRWRSMRAEATGSPHLGQRGLWWTEREKQEHKLRYIQRPVAEICCNNPFCAKKIFPKEPQIAATFHAVATDSDMFVFIDCIELPHLSPCWGFPPPFSLSWLGQGNPCQLSSSVSFCGTVISLADQGTSLPPPPPPLEHRRQSPLLPESDPILEWKSKE